MAASWGLSRSEDAASGRDGGDPLAVDVDAVVACRLARLAARLLGASAAFVKVGSDVRWSGGPDTTETWPTADGLMAYLSLPDAPLVVEDVLGGVVPSVDMAEVGLRAWAATRLRSTVGTDAGIIGVGSFEPQVWSRQDLDAVAELAAVVALKRPGSVGDHGDELRRSRFLAGASGLVSSLPDVAGLPARLTRFCVPSVAAVAVMQQYNGELTTVGLAHRDPAQQGRLEASQTIEPGAVADGSVLQQVLASGEAVCDRLDPTDPLAAGLVFGEGTAGPWRIIAPIRFGEAVRGLLTWVADPDVRYDDADVLLATEFAHRVALAWQWAEVFAERERVAATLQQSLLPARMPTVTGLEIAARYVAADAAVEVGGDFYDLFPVAGRRWLAVIGDVQGRGVEAAGITGQARHTLRAIGPQLGPAESLRRLNRLVHEDPDHDRFLTIATARLNIDQDRMTIVRGGHCPPILIGQSGTVRRLQPKGRILGAFRDVQFEELDVEFGAGDTLVLYTDGVIEARRDGELFGEQRLQQLLAAVAGSSAEEITDRILAAVADFAGVNADDDMALLVLRRPPTVVATRPDGGRLRHSVARRGTAVGPTPVADRRVPVFSLRAVSSLTRIPADDLTAWSERYGLIVPSRTRAGTPVYSGQHLDAARLIAARLREGRDEVAAHAALTDHLTRLDTATDATSDTAGAGTILVVDRDAYLLTVIDRNLRAAGFEVLTASTAAQARAAVAEEPVACAVVDLLLPGESATDLCRDLTGAGVAVLTYSSLRAVDQAFAAGADGFLTKPLNAASLISTVRDILTPAPAATTSAMRSTP